MYFNNGSVLNTASRRRISNCSLLQTLCGRSACRPPTPPCPAPAPMSYSPAGDSARRLTTSLWTRRVGALRQARSQNFPQRRDGIFDCSLNGLTYNLTLHTFSMNYFYISELGSRPSSPPLPGNATAQRERWSVVLEHTLYNIIM